MTSTGREATPETHYRVGPGKCACGYDAYKVAWGFMDYGDFLDAHIRRETPSARETPATLERSQDDDRRPGGTDDRE